MTKPTIKDVFQATVAVTGIDAERLTSTSKGSEVTQARRIGWFVSVILLEHSAEHLTRVWGCSPSGVTDAVREMRRRPENVDHEVAQAILDAAEGAARRRAARPRVGIPARVA